MGLDLFGSKPTLSPVRCANLLEGFPNGCSTKQEIGGWDALTDVKFSAIMNSYSTSVQMYQAAQIAGAKGAKEPKEPKPPVGLIEQRKADSAKKVHFTKRATEWNERMAAGGKELIEERLKAWGSDWRNQGSKDRHQDAARRLAELTQATMSKK